MSAAAPTAPATELPADLGDRQAELNKRTVTALKALALKAGVPVEAGWKKPELVSVLAKNDDAMRAYGWPALTDEPSTEPEAGTGDVDTNGDLIGTAPEYDHGSVTVQVDTAGFPLNGDDLGKLTDEHLTNLRWQLVHIDGIDEPDAALSRDELVAWIVRNGYQVPGQTRIEEQPTGDDVDPVADRVATETANDADAHIPTASTPPTTTHVCLDCNGNAGFQTDTGWEACKSCEKLAAGEAPEDEDGNLSLVIGGEKPMGSFLNVPSLRIDLMAHDVKVRDGDTVRVSFEIPLDKFAVQPEKSGKKTSRRVRTIGGTIDQDTLVIERA
ncbi:MAG: hypothetical protein E6R04_08080 [Spirochaetes bacterium]|nr:MAG: hypothetical protein E6R04_08080 [Spirochaetota bacterium]